MQLWQPSWLWRASLLPIVGPSTSQLSLSSIQNCCLDVHSMPNSNAYPDIFTSVAVGGTKNAPYTYVRKNTNGNSPVTGMIMTSSSQRHRSNLSRSDQQGPHLQCWSRNWGQHDHSYRGGRLNPLLQQRHSCVSQRPRFRVHGKSSNHCRCLRWFRRSVVQDS